MPHAGMRGHRSPAASRCSRKGSDHIAVFDRGYRIRDPSTPHASTLPLSPLLWALPQPPGMSRRPPPTGRLLRRRIFAVHVCVTDNAWGRYVVAGLFVEDFHTGRFLNRLVHALLPCKRRAVCKQAVQTSTFPSLGVGNA